MNLSQYLAKRSQEICADNECTEEDHNCESYAYINEDMELLDLCACDYFQGSSQPYAAIQLPWTGSQTQLRLAVGEQIEEQEEVC